MSVLNGVDAELARLPEDLAPGLRSLARAMAERIDIGKGSPSECGKVLADVLTRLRELAPEEVADDGVDELKAKRQQRRREAS